MRVAPEHSEIQKCEIVLELLAGEQSCEEIVHRWGTTPAEVAEMRGLGLGLKAAIAGARNGDGSSADGPQRGNGTNPLANLGSEMQRQWAAALLGAFLRLQEPDEDQAPSHAA